MISVNKPSNYIQNFEVKKKKTEPLRWVIESSKSVFSQLNTYHKYFHLDLKKHIFASKIHKANQCLMVIRIGSFTDFVAKKREGEEGLLIAFARTSISTPQMRIFIFKRPEIQ